VASPGEDFAVPTVSLPDDHQVLWEGRLHRSDGRLLLFRAYQVQGEAYCRITHSPVGDTAAVLPQADGSTAAPPMPLWSDGSALTSLSAPTAASREQFGLSTADGGKYELSAGDEEVALEVVTRLCGLVLPAADNAAGVGSPLSAAPPIIPVAVTATASDSSEMPLLWIAVALLISTCSYFLSLTSWDWPATSGSPACATQLSCGQHGAVTLHSSADRGEYCECECDDGFTGEDCTTMATMELHEVLTDWVGGAYRKLHEALGEVVAGR
jgi:hypothetical protein